MVVVAAGVVVVDETAADSVVEESVAGTVAVVV